MIRDLRPTTEALRLAVEQFGSIHHLARAIGVEAARVRAWLDGEEPVPPEHYLAIVDLLGKPGA